ncbi:MAG: S8 family serine peptidase [Micropepsaceae bacterium]
MSRLYASLLRLFLCGLLAVTAPFAWADRGRDGGDRDDRDASESGGERGGADRDRADSDQDYGGEGSESRDYDDNDADYGGEGGEGGDYSEAGDDDGPSENSGSGNSGHGHGGKDDPVHRHGRHGRALDHHERISVSRNDLGERVRAGEAIMLTHRADIARRLERRDLRVVESFRLEAIDATAVRVAVPAGMSERQLFDTLHKVDPKSIVTFNHVYDPSGAPSMLTAVRSSVRSRVRAKVGLVDAAVDAKHPMLQQVSVTARSFDPVPKALPDAHGTAVASVIAEAAPGATVYAANVFTLSTDGREIATADAIVRGLDWLATMRIAVINLSLTGPANPVLEAMIKRLNAKGHILVAAVGNEGPRGAAQYPAAYDKVVGVTAVDGKNRVYLYANHGDYVDFAAQGVDLRVADPQGSTDTVSGTSYASPIVAAKLAGSLDTPDVQRAAAAVRALTAEARDLGAPGRDPIYGHGLID